MKTMFTLGDLRDAYLEVARPGEWVMITEVVDLVSGLASGSDVERAIRIANEQLDTFFATEFAVKYSV